MALALPVRDRNEIQNNQDHLNGLFDTTLDRVWKRRGRQNFKTNPSLAKSNFRYCYADALAKTSINELKEVVDGLIQSKSKI